MSTAVQSEIKHDVNIRMNQALTQQMAFIHKSVSRHSGIMKQVSTRFDMSIKRMETVVNKQDKLNAKIGGALERMVGIMGSMKKDGIKIKGTINSTKKCKTSKNEVKESKPCGRTFGIMDSISKRLEAPNRDRDIFNRNSRKFNRNNNVQESKPCGRKFGIMDSISKRLEAPNRDRDIFNRNSRRFNRNNNTRRRRLSPVRGTPKNPALAVLASFGKVLGTVVKGLKTFIGVLGKLNVVGAIVTAGKALYNAMDDIILERRKMLQSGFSFAKEAEGFDGAKLRAAMTGSGVTVERGLKAMEKNATLINKLGVQPFLKTIGDLTADGGIGSLMGDLGMTIPEIDDYASQYMSTLQRLGDTERLREDKRSRATEEFIRQADQMGKVTGLGTKAILDNVLEIQKDVRIRAGTRSLNEEQKVNFEAYTNMITAFTGGDKNASREFAIAALDPASRGLLGSEEGMNLQVALGQTGLGDVFTKLDNVVMNAKNMSPEELGKAFQEITRDIQKADISKAHYDQVVMLSKDSKHGAAASMLLNLMDNAVANAFNVPKKGDSNLTGDEQTGTIKDAALNKAAVTAQNVVSETLDTDGARAAYGTTNKGIAAAAEVFSAATQGIMDALTAVINTMTSLFGTILRPFELLIDGVKAVAKWFGIFGDDDKDKKHHNLNQNQNQKVKNHKLTYMTRSVI